MFIDLGGRILVNCNLITSIIKTETPKPGIKLLMSGATEDIRLWYDDTNERDNHFDNLRSHLGVK